jgi:hypothetical protein
MAAQGWLTTSPCSQLTDVIDRILLQTKFKPNRKKSARAYFELSYFCFIPRRRTATLI